MSKIKVGILFGGVSREREISFAGGRTVYDNLNKSIFEPIPLFIDSRNTIILLDWQYIYKGTIRDFWPTVSDIPPSEAAYQLYIDQLDLSHDEYTSAINKIGRKVTLDELPKLIDIAFLALHGRSGEDGQVQGILEFLNIPYTGSSIIGSAIGMDKSFQKAWMAQSDFESVPGFSKTRSDLETENLSITSVVSQLGEKFVIRPAHQGSSIGVSILNNPSQEELNSAIDLAFFSATYSITKWMSFDEEQKRNEVRNLTDIRSALGLPLLADDKKIASPSQLYHTLENSQEEYIKLQAIDADSTIIFEQFIDGIEFSCVVVVDEDGKPFALPPTQIIKGEQFYDYQSKYMPGRSRKVTPIDLDYDQIINIQEACVSLYKELKFEVYARIDGFYTADKKIILNDPNTTSGMLPSSFFFHQAAEMGLNPSQFITYIIRNSLAERIRNEGIIGRYAELMDRLDSAINNTQSSKQKTRVGVILGGYSFERHISVESGRNIYEKLSSSETYTPIPIFLLGTEDGGFRLIKIPIHVLLKDNADDIKSSVISYHVHEVTKQLKQDTSHLIKKYTGDNLTHEPEDVTDRISQEIDLAFIALHGRPGEDGQIQQYLEQNNIPYNGSGPASSQVTIDKYQTLRTLNAAGFIVTEQLLLTKEEFEHDKNWFQTVESNINYPCIAKPVDDGCSSAVVKIKDRQHLESYLNVLFRPSTDLSDEERIAVGINKNEEFPAKEIVLLENLIGSNGCQHFMEITGGMLWHADTNEVEVFEPSEVLAGDAILSLEEKFLAGEGQNITPARFKSSTLDYQSIATQVKDTLRKAAETIGVNGYCRIDAFVRVYEDARVETIIIEINSLPGMTPATCIFHQCALNGYKPYNFIDKILKFGVHNKSLQSQN